MSLLGTLILDFLRYESITPLMSPILNPYMQGMVSVNLQKLTFKYSLQKNPLLQSVTSLVVPLGSNMDRESRPGD